MINFDLEDNIKSKKPSNRVWEKFKRNKFALFGAIIIFLLVIIAIFAPIIAPHEPNYIDMANFQGKPSSEHWLGTDMVGRDTLSRVIFGTRISLSVGLVSVSIIVIIGTFLGSISGYYGKTIDFVIMRLADVTLSFPMLVLVIVAVSIVGPSIYNIMIVIGLIGWPTLCRIVRAEFLYRKNVDFVVAAQSIGASDLRIITKHILPNCIAPIIVTATFGVAVSILSESGLSFLGLGVQPPTASWGNMLNDAQSIVILEKMPYYWAPPGIAIAITVLAINFIGDGLRDALDPRTLDY